MKCRFYVDQDERRRKGPKHRLAGAEVVLEDPAVGPVRITNLAIWARRDGAPGELSVTFPAVRVPKKASTQTTAANTSDAASEWKDYICAGDEKGEGIKNLRARILAAFRAQYPALALQGSVGIGADAPAKA